MLRARASRTAEAAGALGDASDRVIAMSRTHDQLWRGASSDTVDLGLLLADLCRTLGEQMEHIDLRCSVEQIDAAPDDAASFGLLVTELITNAAKHAYGPGGGVVHVSLHCIDSKRVLTVADEGKGLAADFSIEAAGIDSLGMSLIQALARSLRGSVEFTRNIGTRFTVRF
jgi:two-component sensor histidine kinase